MLFLLMSMMRSKYNPVFWKINSGAIRPADRMQVAQLLPDENQERLAYEQFLMEQQLLLQAYERQK